MLLGGFVVALKLKPSKTQPNYTATKLTYWQKAVKDQPDVPKNWMQLGLTYLEFQQPDQAKSAFQKALSLSANDPGANMQLALLIKDSDPKKAEKMLKLAAAMSPVDYRVVPLVALGELLYSEGHYKAAKAVYSQAVGTDPSIFEARMGLGRTLQALGHEEDALTQYREALRVNPGSAEVKAAIDSLGTGNPPDQATAATPTPST